MDVNVLHDGSTLRTAIIFFYLANEGLSVMENSIALGLPVPEVLRNALAQIKAKSEDTNVKDGESK